METAQGKLGKRKYELGDKPESDNGHHRTESASALPDNLSKECHNSANGEPQESEIAVQTLLASEDMHMVPLLPCLPSRSWRLLEIYFTHMHSWFPIVEKKDLLRTLHQGSTTAHKLRLENQSGHQAVLWSVLALADIQHRSIEPSTLNGNDEQPLSTEQLYFHARSQIPTETGNFEFGHVQALLILSLYNFGLNQHQAAWLLIGQASRLAIQLGLNRCSPTSLQPQKPSTTTQENRIFLGCFALDALIAARLGRCPHLGVEDLYAIGGSVEENGLEEWDPWIDCLGRCKGDTPLSFQPPLIFSTFNRFVKVLCTLNESIRHRPADAKQGSKFPELIEELRRPHIEADEAPQLSTASSTSSELLPHHLNYHLTYFSALATLRIRQCRLSGLETDLRSQVQDLGNLVQQMSLILSRFSDCYGLVTAPPTCEYFTSIMFEAGRVYDKYNVMSKLTIQETPWKSKIFGQLPEMCKVWPSFALIWQKLDQECAINEPIDIFQTDFSDSIFKEFELSNLQNITPYWESPGEAKIHEVVEGDRNGEHNNDYSNPTWDTLPSPNSNTGFKNHSASLDSGPQAISSPQQNNQTSDHATSPSTLLTQHEARRGSPHSVSALNVQTNPPQSPPAFGFDVPLDQDALFNEFTRVDTMVSPTSIYSPCSFETTTKKLAGLGLMTRASRTSRSSDATNLDFYDLAPEGLASRRGTTNLSSTNLL
jgi:hypothetical protein